jgi:hypothetical protein
MGVLTQHMFEPVPDPQQVNPAAQVPDALSLVVKKALAKDPDERYRSMDEFGRALVSAMESSASVGSPAEARTGVTLLGYGEPVKARASARARPIEAEAATGELPSVGRSGRRGLLLGVGVGVAVAVAGVIAAVVVPRGGPVTAAPGDSGRVGLLGEDAPGGVVHSGTGGSAGTGTAGAGSSGAGGEAPRGEAGGAMPDPGPGATAGTGTVVGADSVSVGDAGAGGAMADELVGDGGVPVRTVEIHVETRPSGAIVSVDGRGTVCDESPCTFSVPAEERIVVRARKGRAVATRELRAMTSTRLELSLATSRPGGGSDRGGSGGTSAGSGVGTGELKIPDIFRNP